MSSHIKALWLMQWLCIACGDLSAWFRRSTERSLLRIELPLDKRLSSCGFPQTLSCHPSIIPFSWAPRPQAAVTRFPAAPILSQPGRKLPVSERSRFPQYTPGIQNLHAILGMKSSSICPLPPLFCQRDRDCFHVFPFVACIIFCVPCVRDGSAPTIMN